MTIKKLTIADVRNLASVSIQPSPEINVFYGQNGSGKTSVLEAIHILGLARSFRTTRVKPVVRTDQSRYTVFAQLASQVPVGVSRGIRDDNVQIRIAGQSVRSSAELAALLPVQVINPDTFRLLEGSPALRRNFLDWGVFHVKHREFLPLWKNMQMALKQRNSLIRHGRMSGAEIDTWSRAFAGYADQVDQLRQAHVAQLLPYFSRILDRLCPLEGLTLSYYRGWDKDRPLDEILASNLTRDCQAGYTSWGPQRADLRVRLGRHSAVEILSRGQLKLVVCALKLAQSDLLADSTGQKSIFLVDDLPSELDHQHRMALCHVLQNIESQVFITCVEKNALADCWLPEKHHKLFHVKQGRVDTVKTPGRAEPLEIEHD